MNNPVLSRWAFVWLFLLIGMLGMITNLALANEDTGNGSGQVANPMLNVTTLILSDNIELPIVSAVDGTNKSSQLAAEAMNIWLQEKLLRKIIVLNAPLELQQPLSQVQTVDGNSMKGLIELGYSVLPESNNILSLQISRGWVGAHYKHFVYRVHFNPTTGQPIFLNQMFTEDGFEQFKSAVVVERIVAIEQFLQLPLFIQPQTIDFDDKHLYAETAAAVDKHLSNNIWSVVQNGINIEYHLYDGKKLQDLAPFTVSLEADQLQPWLSSYGQCLLHTHKKSCVEPLMVSTLY